MGYYTNHLKYLNELFKKQYDPKTAFADPKLVEIQTSIDRITAEMDGKEECSDCDGYGSIECNECGSEKECRYCEDGLVAIKEETV